MKPTLEEYAKNWIVKAEKGYQSGLKYDEDKLDYTLLPWDQIEKVVEILNYGAKKYGKENWRHLKDGKNRYAAAAMRHLVSYMKGQDKDEESGYGHLYHAITNLLFLAHFNECNKD